MQHHAYKIKLESIFEGPMDLLVHLIKKHEMDIYEIPIALITDQFLAYIEWIQSLNIEIASDFLVMAATLAHIKSRMLLPKHKNNPATEENSEDPQMDIAARLMEYLQIKDIARQLSEKSILDEDVFTRNPDKSSFLIQAETEIIKTDLFDLISAYHKLLNKTSARAGIRIIPERISVKDKMSEIIHIIKEKGTITLMELLPKKPERMDIVVTFLAILEIVKLNLAQIAPNDTHSGLRLFYI